MRAIANATRRDRLWLVHMTIAVILGISAQSNDRASAQTTNLYHTNRVFTPITINAAPTRYSVSTMAGKLTEVIKGEDVRPISNETYATEYDSMAWGYGSAAEAWGAVVSNFPACSVQTNTGVYYDNAGWVKGTHEVVGPAGTTGSTGVPPI